MPTFSNGIAHEHNPIFIRCGRAKLRVSVLVPSKPGKIKEHLAVVLTPIIIVGMAGSRELGCGWRCWRGGGGTRFGLDAWFLSDDECGHHESSQGKCKHSVAVIH